MRSAGPVAQRPALPARMVAQRTFERTMGAGQRCRALTEDYLAAVATVRSTLTPKMVTEFAEDTKRHVLS
jgi:hypothetical protein